jgi:hypothetical protein
MYFRMLFQLNICLLSLLKAWKLVINDKCLVMFVFRCIHFICRKSALCTEVGKPQLLTAGVYLSHCTLFDLMIAVCNLLFHVQFL